MSARPSPEGNLGAEARINGTPAPELIAAGYAIETADAPLLHHGLGLADLAHVMALADAEVIPTPNAAALVAVLLDALATPPEKFPYSPAFGDAYNSREREFERRLGRTAGWLHTGRTRREAGRIAFRLALRDLLLAAHEAVAAFARAIADRAEEHASAVWADTTYLQPAQPSTFGHYLASFGEAAVRHLARLEAAYAWADRSPAGVGGVGGSRVPLDRSRLADALGFGAIGEHTRDVMWAADGLVDAVVAAAQAATTVDQLAEDLEIFTSPGFEYVRLDASLCRASVLLPQKRNPYALAALRAGASTLIGRAAGMLVMQRTPSARTDNWLHAYGEVAGALDLARCLVALGTVVVRTLQVDRDALAAAASTHFTGAADLAEELVLRHELDYRSAYRVVGRAVAAAIGAGRTTLDPADLDTATATLLGRPLGVSPLEAALEPTRIVATRTVPGGSAPRRVREHCGQLRRRIDEGARWCGERRVHNEQAEEELLAAARRLAATASVGATNRSAAAARRAAGTAG